MTGARERVVGAAKSPAGEGARVAERGVVVEHLEARTFFSASLAAPAPIPINLTHAPGQQSEGSLAIDPSNPARLFAASNETGSSLFGAASLDGGITWVTRQFANGSDGLPTACCDPSAAFDTFGNLFFAYLGVDNHVRLLLSTDGGANFTLLQAFKGDGDQPTVVTSSGSVWVAFQLDADGAIAYAARVTGLAQVRRFKGQRIAGAPGQNVGDIAIGPQGQVLVAYQAPNTQEGASTIYTRLDSDGVGQHKFAAPVPVANTNVGDFDRIPAQPHRSIDAEIALAYDNSGGPFTGRVYLVYTDEQPDESNNTDIFLSYSENDGATWSTPIRVNDDATVNSQFFPRIAVDQFTGNVALSWHDARNDLGIPGHGSNDALPNNDVQFYGAVGAPTSDGLSLSPNFQITAGTSSAQNPANQNDYGDYTALAFANGLMYPGWADDSNSTLDNPDGALVGMDLYISRLPIATTPPPLIGGPTARILTKKPSRSGSTYSFTVSYSDNVDPSTLDGADLLVTGPNGFAHTADLVRIRHKNGLITATYRIIRPRGDRGSGPGTYLFSLQPGAVADVLGNTAAARPLFSSVQF